MSKSRFRLLLVLTGVLLYVAQHPSTLRATHEDWCDDTNVCNSSADCGTTCTNRDVNPNENITCNDYNGGWQGGSCQNLCGDSLCEDNEDDNNCSDDCSCVDSSSFGLVTSFMTPDAATRVNDIGAGSVRLNFFWGAIESDEGSFNWYDAINHVGLSQYEGYDILISISGTPSWAFDPQIYTDVQDAWYDFVAQAIDQFADSNVVFGVWNEPDLYHDGELDLRDPEVYAHFVEIADAARDTVNSDARLAYPEAYNALNDDFLSDVLNEIDYLGASAAQDVITVHFYDFGNQSESSYMANVTSIDDGRETWLSEVGGSYADLSAALQGHVANVGGAWAKTFIYVLQGEAGATLCDGNWTCNSKYTLMYNTVHNRSCQ